MDPGLTVWPAQQGVRLLIIYDLSLVRVPGKRSAELHSNVGQNARGGCDVAFLDVGDGASPRFHHLQEVLPVYPHGGRHVTFQVFFGLVFRVLVILVEGLALGRFALALGNKIVLMDIGLERSLVAVDKGRPGIFGVRCMAPRAMRPHHGQLAEVERGRLGVRDIGLAVFVHEDAAG